MTETPKEIWAWHFTPSKQNDVIKGGWDDAPDRKCTHYTRTDTIPTWQPIATAKRDKTHVLLLLLDGSVCDGWFCRGEWSESTPIAPAEYSGDSWVCCDDRFSIEVEDCGEDGYNDGEVTHWMPYLSRRQKETVQ